MKTFEKKKTEEASINNATTHVCFVSNQTLDELDHKTIC